MKITIETGDDGGTITIEGGKADTEPPTRATSEEHEHDHENERPTRERFDRSEARDAGGPPREIAEPVGRGATGEHPETGEDRPTTEERATREIHSGGAFQRPGRDEE